MTDTSAAFIPNLDTVAARAFATDIDARVTELEVALTALQAVVATLQPPA